ncbi:hypothetical protein [Sphaerospermopsis aphanizomenoides]|nr:hypothetical protein [Sphaerospermopsis aphanizomenoides]
MAIATAIFYIFLFYVKVEYLQVIGSDLSMTLETINNSSWQKKQ